MDMNSIIGVDEAGRGPVMGPMVIAGFMLPSADQAARLKDMRVRDSKQITPRRRQQLADQLRKIGKYTIKTISAAEIDERRKHQTLNTLEAELFAQVIITLSPEKGATIMVDSADANEETFKRYIEEMVGTDYEIISKHKADEMYTIVGAASILAKTERDAQMARIARELDAQVGSGYPADPITVNFLEKWIKEKRDLPPHTRRSWKTAQKLLKDIKAPIRTLDKFGD